MNTLNQKRPLKIIICKPLGFCAGVNRAIQIVEKTLKKFGKPIYVRHEIVHNKFIIENFKNKGVIFIKNLDEIPNNNKPVIFSAHGTPIAVLKEAKKRNLFQIDATCPLVSKIHFETKKYYKNNLEIILIGHANHPEVIGIIGQLPNNTISLIETKNDINKLKIKNPNNVVYISQTTLSIDDTKEIILALKNRFPNIIGPKKNDICYATTNRQKAVKTIIHMINALIVVGAPHSSNSRRLVEIAKNKGCKSTILIERANEIDWKIFKNTNVIGLTAGASAPDILIKEIINTIQIHYNVTIEFVITAKETIIFNLPKELRDNKNIIAT